MSHWNHHATGPDGQAGSPVFRLQAPGIVGDPLSPSAALDAALTLARRNVEVPCLSAAAMHCMMVEPILAGTYVLISTRQSTGAWQPMGWLAYALFDADAESRYVDNPARFIHPADWNKGDRLWMLHWVVEPGHTRPLLRMVRHVFGGLTARSLSRHGNDRLTIWRGPGCSPEDATKFWQRRPVLSQESGVRSSPVSGSGVVRTCVWVKHAGMTGPIGSIAMPGSPAPWAVGWH